MGPDIAFLETIDRNSGLLCDLPGDTVYRPLISEQQDRFRAPAPEKAAQPVAPAMLALVVIGPRDSPRVEKIAAIEVDFFDIMALIAEIASKVSKKAPERPLEN